ncbi:uncharacterized protein LOC124434348 isoform X1 [Xenia sp. Carnegie-2017]|uniref:uncharacterized protein LOC124434348 isoform X1 n=1 Tax=Xenia sp. Carnegie-2017 TaxID=2897299 RepID=UPI001F038663|nr:uncharacterized protein LOC124434348 isoform X1 [Xenia sp. Carnegie-2017]
MRSGMINCLLQILFLYAYFCQYIKLIEAKFITPGNNTVSSILDIFTTFKHHHKLQLSCRVSWNLTVNISWYRGRESFSVKSHRVGNVTWGNISVENYLYGDVYMCVVETTEGFLNKSYVLSCFDELECLQWHNIGQQLITVDNGGSFTIKCELHSGSTLHNKAILENCYEYGVVHGNQTIVEIQSHQSFNHRADRVIFKHPVINAGFKDAGLYSCFYRRKNFSAIHKCGHSPQFNVTLKSRLVSDASRRLGMALALAVGSVFAGVSVVVFVFCLRKRKLKRRYLNESDVELRWDVFVSYNSKDFAWVKELCKLLENAPFNLTVCLHQRDWEVGRTVVDNMAESVYFSRKTLLVVSKDYLLSPFCLQELNIALEFEKRKALKDRIILIKLDNASLKRLPKSLQKKSYLDFSDEQQRKYFKEKLLQALRVQDRAKEDVNAACDFFDETQTEESIAHSLIVTGAESLETGDELMEELSLNVFPSDKQALTV